MSLNRYIILLGALAMSFMTMVAAPRISLITIGPGDKSYQLEGHSALRVITEDGHDMAVNWGIYDFNAPNFAYRFIKGETDYCIGVYPFARLLWEYDSDGRYVVEQQLNLSDAEAQAAWQLIEENMRPENVTYRYNYLYDNCATRPLAIIEKALAADGAKLEINLPDSVTTFRKELSSYHTNFPTYQLFVDFALGSGIDHPITAREQAFAPIFLKQLADNSLVVNKDGTSRPLVISSTQYLSDTVTATTTGGISPAWVVLIFTIITLWVTWRDLKRGKVSRWFDAIFYSIYGIAGLLCAFLVFISIHEATSPNINILWLNPLCLIVPLIIGFKRLQKVVSGYQLLNLILCAIWLIGLPFFTQNINWLFIPLILCNMARAYSYITINFKQCVGKTSH